MSEHATRDQLLGLELGLSEGEEASSLRRHVELCGQCRSRMSEVVTMLGERPGQAGGVARSRWLDWRRRFLSSWTPGVVMLLSVIASAVGSEGDGTAGLSALVVGSLVVVFWLHWVVALAERGWRSTSVVELVEALPSAEERSHFVEGVRLSVVSSLIEARQKVGRVLSVSLGLFIVAAMLTLLSGVYIHSVATAVVAERPVVIPGALAAGLLLGGVVWSSWRLRRLAREIVGFFEELSEHTARTR